MFHRHRHHNHDRQHHDGHDRRHHDRHDHDRHFARRERRLDDLEFGTGRHGHGRGGGGGGVGRFFAHGDLRLVILHLIQEKPRHGYELIKAIEDQVGGAYSPSPGVVYPTLTMLEELGHVTVTAGEGGKKLHTITLEGRAYLDAYKAVLDALLARMAEAGRVRAGSPAPQIVRAMENLRLALRLRLSRGPLTDAQANAVAAALDSAATGIEQA